MKVLSTIVFVFSVSTIRLWGQADMKKNAEADNLFSNNSFGAALPIYLDSLTYYPSDADLNYKAGICYLNSRSQKAKAAGYLTKAVGTTLPAVTIKYQGDAYFLDNKFDLAITSYEKFKKIFLANKPKYLVAPKDTSLLEEINWKIEMCRIGKRLKELDTSRNDQPSRYMEYVSTLSADQSIMTLTFQKPGGIKNKLSAGEKYFEDLYIPVNADFDLTKRVVDTTTTINEATVATSLDGQIVLIYRDEKGDGNLYVSRLSENKWTSPEKLSSPVNLKGWEFNEYISADGYSLYFTSSRAGGFGGKDIYTCTKLPNGEWGKATNMGPIINTSFDEEAPFIYSDKHTLFFSSNKNKQSCCFDVFSSTLGTDGTWSEPKKVGYPAKTKMDDILYATTTTYQEYSPAAIRAGVYNKKDLYFATFTDQKKFPFSVLKGKVIDIDGKVPKNVKITVTDNETGEVSGIYSSHYKTGDYILPLPPGRNNNIIYEADGYLFHSENIDLNKKDNYYETHKVDLMSPLGPDSKIILSNVFFDIDRASILPASMVELNKIFLLLSRYTDMSVQLSYLIDTKENKSFFAVLARKRAQSVVDYLINKGISKDRVTEKDSGKQKEVKNKYDKKNTEEDKISGERLELKILGY